MNDFTQIVADRAIAERERQKNELGYTRQHDSGSEYELGELATAACGYILTAADREALEELLHYTVWPKNWAQEYYKPDQTGTLLGRLRELEKGIALALAEMERIYGMAYEAIPNVAPDGLNYTQWVEAIKQYIVLERQCGFDVKTVDDLAGKIDPDSQDWHDMYNDEYTARFAFEAMYYEH